jgi:hypothetical protein
MRREHNVEQSYVDWLKSLGCVVYLPLTEGDLQDKISGNTLVVNNNRVTWDNNVGMYLFNAGSSSSSPAATLQTICDSSTFANGVMTIMGIVKRGSSYGTVGGGSSPWNENCKGTNNNVTADTGYWSDNVMKRATIIKTNPSKRLAYQDGIKILDDTYTPVIDSLIPLRLVAYSGWGYTNATIYEREVMFFNQELDLSTIKRIQGIE